MIFIENMKNFKIYRTKTFLPTVKGNKKKGSAVLLLTPNYESSNKLMNNPMFVNMRRYASYYIERDVSYYINSKVAEEVDDEEIMNESIELSTFMETKRSELPDSEFGVPSKRKFPLDTEAHVRSAIKFFNYVDPEDEEELAKRIIAAMKKFNITDVKVSEKNRFSKYYRNPVNEATIIPATVKNIVFDLGSVLVKMRDWKKELKNGGIPTNLIDKYCKTYEEFIKEDDTSDIITAKKTFKSLFINEENAEELQKYSDKALDILVVAGDPYEYTVSLLQSLKDKGYKLYYLSNWSRYGFESCKESGLFDFLEMFDGGVVSYQVGMLKPFKGIYTNFLTEYKLDPKECLFFDDKKENVAGAKAVGMNAKLFTPATVRQIMEIKSVSESVILEKKERRIPTCPKCGKNNNVGIAIKGEPIYWCKDCDCYVGDVPFDSSKLEAVVPESVLNTGDKIMFFGENTLNDSQLKRILYHSRIRYRKDLMLLLDKAKKDNPWIKFTFPNIKKYLSRNVFMDLYFYNNIFFENNKWVLKKGLTLFSEYMTRLVNHPVIKAGGYTKKTIFIPVADWDKLRDGSVWNFRKNINPISCIYQMMFENSYAQLIKAFGNTDIIFVASDKYFKLNFSQIDAKDIKKKAMKFRLFCTKICKNEEFELDDIDTSADNAESPEVIQAKLVDKIEKSKGVDLTKKVDIAYKRYQDRDELNKVLYKGNKVPAKLQTLNKLRKDSFNKSFADSDIDTITTQNLKARVANLDNEDLEPQDTSSDDQRERDLDKLADIIANVSQSNSNEDDAMDSMDTNDDIKRILIDLGNDDEVNISDARASRMSELDKALLDKEVKGRSVKDILEDESSHEEEKTKVEVASPNEEEWSEMGFMNFDKNYNIDKDIISIFQHFSKCSRPISVRDIKVTDNSNSENRTMLYDVDMEDYRGSRFKVRLDIPIMEDNRFLLRGNEFSIQTQSFNMPIIKTELDTCQLISNYKKIFLYRVGDSKGRSLPGTSKIIKAASKYKGRKLKFIPGNNLKVCAKYHLPIDYIDLAGVFSKIESDDWIIYFNQDEIRELYTVEPKKGVPFLFNKKINAIEYLHDNGSMFSIELANILFNYCKEFADIFDSVSRTTACAYSRASIMASDIPVVLICAYHVGLTDTMNRAQISYEIVDKLDRDTKLDITKDWIEFNDGYIVYYVTYQSSLLMNGLKKCPTEMYNINEMDNKSIYVEMLDRFGGRIKADGLDNFRDLFVDPMIEESLKYYHLPTDYIDILLYGSNLLSDNKFVKHTDNSSRRFRRYQLIAVYTYIALSTAYGQYANKLKHSSNRAEFNVKQSAVIDLFLTDPITSPNSINNALGDIETTNGVTTKGPSGMNADRAYSLDKRTYDDSMVNVLGMSTGFAGNVGITRQATMNSNVTADGYVKDPEEKEMNDSNTLTATEAMVPFGSTRDDPMRTAMSFIQTAKHMVRTEDSDPLLVTSGADEVIPYMASDKFAFKAKQGGKVIDVTDDYIIIEYDDGTKDYVDLRETTENNSDGGYFVPMKLTAAKEFKVGMRFNKNQILAYDQLSFSNKLGESDNLAYNIGKIAKVAIINSDEGFEDSGVISASMAKKLATKIELKYDSVIDRDSRIFKIAKIGDHIEASDDLLVWDNALDDEDTNDLIASLSLNDDDFADIGKRKLKSEVTGVLKDIKIYRTVELEDLSPSLRQIVEDYEKPLKAMAKKLRDNDISISKLPAHYILPPTGKLKRAQDAILIEFYVEYLDTVGVGDKIVYNSANKAVEKDIFPEGKEPYTEFRPNEKIDAFVSVTSINKRMVSSSIIYGSLQKLMVELDRSVKDIMGIPYDDTTV